MPATPSVTYRKPARIAVSRCSLMRSEAIPPAIATTGKRDRRNPGGSPRAPAAIGSVHATPGDPLALARAAHARRLPVALRPLRRPRGDALHRHRRAGRRAVAQDARRAAGAGRTAGIRILGDPRSAGPLAPRRGDADGAGGGGPRAGGRSPLA